MNVERLTTIAEWLEAKAPARNGVVRFNMQHFDARTECGAVCCIAGAAVHFFHPDWIHLFHEQIFGNAAALLELDSDTADTLFFAMPVRVQLGEIPTDWAARCVRKLIATGQVDWYGTRNPS